MDPGSREWPGLRGQTAEEREEHLETREGSFLKSHCGQERGLKKMKEEKIVIGC